MLIEMTKPGRTSSQYANERDAVWLEQQGWVRAEKQPEPAQPEQLQQLLEVSAKKRGRPFKKDANVNHDIR